MPREHPDSREGKQWNNFKATCRKANPKDHNDKYYKQVRAVYKAQTQGYTLDRCLLPESKDSDAGRFHDGLRKRYSLGRMGQFKGAP